MSARARRAVSSSMPTASRRTEIDEATGEELERDIPFMKGYTVFNVEQIEGLPAHFYAPAEPRLDPVQRIDAAEAFFAATGADIRHGGNQAYYSHRPRPRADAAVRDLPRRRKLLRHARP